MGANPDQVLYRCVYRGSNPIHVFKGCLKCPGNIKGYECHHPAILAKNRPKHICIVHGPELKEMAAEEGYFMCSGCRYRSKYLLPENPQWAVGVTSAPRANSTLQRSLASLAAAGWPDATVFAEPGTDLTQIGNPAVRRKKLMGGWGNWFATLGDLVAQDPDICLICQDDVVYAQNIRSYVEREWPEGCEIMSFYCSSSYDPIARHPFYRSVPSRGGVQGALCWAICRPTAERILENQAMRARLKSTGIDGVVGVWARKQGIEIFTCYPSLAEHIGDTSVLHPDVPNIGRRCSASFVGEDFVCP